MEGFSKIKPTSLADYLGEMSKAVFQTGISWKVVESKWPEIKEAMHGFDPQTIARLSPRQVDDLLQDRRVIRNRRKIEAIVGNAQQMLELERDYGSFKKYLRSFASFAELTKDLRKRFKFLGEMGTYHFLWVVGEKVPSWEDWSAEHIAR